MYYFINIKALWIQGQDQESSVLLCSGLNLWVEVAHYDKVNDLYYTKLDRKGNISISLEYAIFTFSLWKYHCKVQLQHIIICTSFNSLVKNQTNIKLSLKYFKNKDTLSAKIIKKRKKLFTISLVCYQCNRRLRLK